MKESLDENTKECECCGLKIDENIKFAARKFCNNCSVYHLEIERQRNYYFRNAEIRKKQIKILKKRIDYLKEKNKCLKKQ